MFSFTTRILTIVLVLLTMGVFCSTSTAANPFDALRQRLQENQIRSLFFQSHYSEAVKKGEAYLKQYPDRDYILLIVCGAYFRIKDYREMLSCADRIDARIAAGITEYEFDSLRKYDWTPMPGVLRAAAYLDFGEYARALSTGQVALARIGELESRGNWTDNEITSYFNSFLLPILGLAAAHTGNNELALRYADQLENLKQPALLSLALFLSGSGNFLYNEGIAGVARIHAAIGQCDKALDILASGKAGTMARDLVVVAISLVAASKGSRTGFAVSAGPYAKLPLELLTAKCLIDTGKIDAGGAVLDDMLADKLLADQRDLMWIALYERGLVADRQSDESKAVDFYERSVEVLELQRSTIKTETGKIGFVGDKQDVYARLIADLFKSGRYAEAFDYVERAKSRALVDMLAARKDFAVAQGDIERAKQALAEIDRTELASMVVNEGTHTDTADKNARPSSEGESIATNDALVVESNRVTRELSLSRNAIRSASPELLSLVSVGAVPRDEIRNLLGADETLVEYYYGDGAVYAFLLSRESFHASRFDAGRLVAQVEDLRSAINAVTSDDWKAHARQLYDLLWSPLEKLGLSRNVTVVPHGPLHYLPFAALQSADGAYVVDKYALRFLPSASVLKFLRPPMQGKEFPILAFGDPDLGDSRLDLKFAESEATTIGSMYPGSRVLVRGEASETNFRKIAPLFPRLHLATHGELRSDAPLTSGLYLAHDSDNDGLLTVGELYSISLDADLVTLSACQTGLGQIASGDDVVGLLRGFLYAGSRSVVSTLWSVDDRATNDLMVSFYRNLGNMGKSEALRQAQIDVRRSFAPPFFWAAFQLTGRR